MMDVKIERPLLPLRDIVVFPNMVVPLFVGRDKSIAALNEVMKKDKKIVLVTQKNSEIDDPKKTDVFMYGCEGNILQLLKLPDGTVKVLVEGSKRVKILDFKDNEKFIICEYAHHHDVVTKDEDLIPLAMTAVRRLEKLTSINKKVSSETINNIKKLTNASHIADNIASHLTATISEKQQIFETIDVKKRLNSIIKIMENETSIIGVEKRIRGRVKTQMEKTQREYYLNEQLKAIQKELGEIEDGKDETSSLNKLIIKAKMPKDVEKKCMAELKKLKNMSPMSAEATVIRNYLDWMTDLPWFKKSEVDIDLKKALSVLDADHFGLEKVKERIIEFLAVQKRMDKIKGPILCLVGPPGVGKSFGVEKVLGKHDLISEIGGTPSKYQVVKGAMSAIGLYCKLFNYADKDNVLVFDDCDSIFADELSLNILKAALDSKKNRTIHWNTDSFKLRNEGVPDSFEFKGSAIFITNLKFDSTRQTKIKDHLEAILSRCHYLDLTLDTTRDKIMRIKQIARDGGLFDTKGLTKIQEQEIIEFMVENQDRLREVSLRMAQKIADLLNMNKARWKALAESTCMKRRVNS